MYSLHIQYADGKCAHSEIIKAPGWLIHGVSILSSRAQWTLLATGISLTYLAVLPDGTVPNIPTYQASMLGWVLVTIYALAIHR